MGSDRPCSATSYSELESNAVITPPAVIEITPSTITKEQKTTAFSVSAEKSRPPPWAHFMAGGIAGCVGTLATCPLEVVKTRLQALNNKSILQVKHPFGLGTIYHLKAIAQTEGIRGLWKGIGPNLVGVIPARAIYFGTYSMGKSGYSKLLKADATRDESSWIHLGSAITAGLVTAFATSPLWLIKTRMQLQTSTDRHAYLNSFDCAVRVWREEGIAGFYKGLSASIIGISEGTLNFVLYERFKAILQKRKAKMRGTSTHTASAKNEQLSSLEYFSIASAARLVASAGTYPHEVIRTRLREQRGPAGTPTKYTGFVQCFVAIAREEGVRGLYGGMGAHLVRVVPNSALMFLTYETVIWWVTRHTARTEAT